MQQLRAVNPGLHPGLSRKTAQLTGPGIHAVVVTQMPFSFELMHQPRHVAGRFARQPLLHLGQGKRLLDQENFEGAIETLITGWTSSISHGILVCLIPFVWSLKRQYCH